MQIDYNEKSARICMNQKNGEKRNRKRNEYRKSTKDEEEGALIPVDYTVIFSLCCARNT